MQPVAPAPGVSLGQPVGDYRLGRLIGQGRRGAVYEATHQQSGQRVAVRMLQGALQRNPGAVARFPYEARTVSLVNHASICEIRELGILQDGAAFLVMEFLEGETLGQRLRRSGRLEEGQALTVARQVARGLAVAHGADVVHGDLRPDNVVLVRDPWRPDAERAKVADLGLLRMLTGGADIGELSRAVGAPPYLSPEQRAGTPTDVQADVWALGVLLYEMIVGQPPYPGATIEEVNEAQVRGAPPSLRDADPMLADEMVDIIGRMLAPSPGDRPRMQEVAEALDHMDAYRATRAHAAITGGDGPPSKPQAPGRGTMAWAQVVLQQRQEQRQKEKDTRTRRQAEGGRGLSRRALLGFMGATMIAATGGGLIYLARHHDEPPKKPEDKPGKRPDPADKPAEPAKPPEKPAQPAQPVEPVTEKPAEPPDEEGGKKGKRRRKRDKQKKEPREKKRRRRH